MSALDRKRALYETNWTIELGRLWAQNQARITAGAKDRYSLSEEELRELIKRIELNVFKFNFMTRIYIPKANKPWESRPITMPFKKDLILMDALLFILNRTYEPVFCDCSHGFRAKRSISTFCAEVSTWVDVKCIMKSDFVKCFDKIPHNLLISGIRKRIYDNRVVNLIEAFCSCQIIDRVDNKPLPRLGVGILQGSPISPLLMNVYCHEIDLTIKREFPNLYYVRYADDMLLGLKKTWSKNNLYKDKLLSSLDKVKKNLEMRLISLFKLQIKTDFIFMGGEPTNVLGLQLAIDRRGKPYFKTMRKLVRSRIMKRHKEGSPLSTADWNNKQKGYLSLYSGCMEDDLKSFEAFQKRKSGRLLNETEKEKISSNYRNSSGRLTWGNSLHFKTRFRKRYLLKAREYASAKRRAGLGKR